jgi:hypothetical protein
MAEYTVKLDDEKEGILTYLGKGKDDNQTVLQALVDQKLSEYAYEYNLSLKRELHSKIEYAATKEELKADYEAFLGKVEAQMASDTAAEVKPEVGLGGAAEEPVQP